MGYVMELRFPAPSPAPSINDFNRTRSWAKRVSLVKPWREAAGWSWKAQPITERQKIMGKPCLVGIEIPFSTNRIRDPHNYFVITKACVDELVKCSAWPDDNPKWVLTTEPELIIGKECVIRISLR